MALDRMDDIDESDASMRARLVNSLSSSFPGSALSRALHAIDEDDMDNKDPLSSSCYAELRLDQIKSEDDDDDDLTSLNWLQDHNLLKNIDAGDRSLCTSPVDKENGYDDTKPVIHGQTHPSHVLYNPHKHIHSKPPYSFSCLIFMAVEDSPIKKLPVKDIYNWILTHFPYFNNAPTGWKNSVRHNLSLNKCFKKVEKDKGSSIGKGSLWCIDPDYRPNLLQALRKTPYHPYHQLQILNNPQPNNNYIVQNGQKPFPLAPRININSPSPHLFPFLSKRLAQSKYDTESDIDVANTLVSMKRAAEDRSPLSCRNGWDDRNGARSRSPSPPEFGSAREKQLLKMTHRPSRPQSPIVCTAGPTPGDHTYCLTEAQLKEMGLLSSPRSSIDEEYDFGPEDHPSDMEYEEEDSNYSDSDLDEGCEDHRSSGKSGAAVVKSKSSTGASVKDTDRGVSKGVVSDNRGSKSKTVSPVPKSTEDEQIKIAEGADALLNLAGIMTLNIAPRRPISPSSNNNNNNNIEDNKGAPSAKIVNKTATQQINDEVTAMDTS